MSYVKNRLSKHLLICAGIDPSSVLAPAAHCVLPSATSEWVALECDGAPDLALAIMEASPEVVVLRHLRGELDILEGHVQRLADGSIGLDLADGRAAAMFLNDDGVDFIVTADLGTGVTVFVLDSKDALSEQGRGSTDVVQRLLADSSCDEWLAAEARRLESTASELDTVAAIGLIGRLRASPPWRGGSADELKPPPCAGARSWARALSLEDRARLVPSAMRRVRELEADLQHLEVLTAEDGHELFALELVRRRDDLESIAWVLAADDSFRTPLDAELEELDREASCHLTEFGMSAETLAGDARIRAVSWQEPDAWWGSFALG